MKHNYDFSIIFIVLLSSIFGTAKVDSVLIFDILEHPKLSSLDLIKSTESTQLQHFYNASALLACNAERCTS